MLKQLIEEYQNELDKFNNHISFEEYHEIKQKELSQDEKWADYGKYLKEYPEGNKAKLKRLGIMIRQKMVELENGIN